jgi:uncharacterized protein YcbK (DUF882 family)/LysM repeat protein
MLPDFSRFRGQRARSAAAGRSLSSCARALRALVATALLAAPSAADAADHQHTVSRGQTLYAIAKRYRTTVDALCAVNGLTPKQRLQPGLVLTIPERGKTSGAGQDAAKAQGRAAPSKAASARREFDRRGGAKSPPQEPGAMTSGAGARRRGAMPGKDAGAGTGKDARRPVQRPKRPGWVRLVRGGEQIEVQLISRQGRLMPKALPKLSRLMRASQTASIPVDPRLATLIAMVSDHFGGRTLRVVSGYRPYSPTQYTPHSNHNFGRAIDFVVDGVPNTVVRDYCRSFRNAGVGYYPNSTFVHLDVRSVKTYWVDYSRAGEPPRYDAAKGSLAADEAARDVPGAVEEEVYGSPKTRSTGSQEPDIKGTNQPMEDAPPQEDKSGGQNSPSPPPVTPPAPK